MFGYFAQVLKRIVIIWLMLVMMLSQIGGSYFSLQSLLTGVFAAHPLVMLVLASCAGVGLFLLYFDGVCTWINKNLGVDQARQNHYKKTFSGGGFKVSEDVYVKLRKIIHKLKNKQLTNEQVKNIEELKARVPVWMRNKLQKIIDGSSKNVSWFGRIGVKLLAVINYLVCNPVNAMVGAALLAITVCGSVSGGALIFVAGSSFCAGGFFAYAVTQKLLTKLASRFFGWMRSNEEINYSLLFLKISITFFVVCASAGSAYWGGLSLLVKMQALLGPSSWLGAWLLNVPAFVPGLIAAFCCVITVFAAGALYYSSVDSKINSMMAASKSISAVSHNRLFASNVMLYLPVFFWVLLLPELSMLAIGVLASSTAAMLLTGVQALYVKKNKNESGLPKPLLLVVALLHVESLALLLCFVCNSLFGVPISAAIVFGVASSLLLSREYLLNDSPFSAIKGRLKSFVFACMAAFGLTLMYSQRFDVVLFLLFPSVAPVYLYSIVAIASVLMFANFLLGVLGAVEKLDWSHIVSTFAVPSAEEFSKEPGASVVDSMSADYMIKELQADLAVS